MEHIFFEVQLCSEILIFKEKHVFGILINLCLGTSLVQEEFQVLREVGGSTYAESAGSRCLLDTNSPSQGQ